MRVQFKSADNAHTHTHTHRSSSSSSKASAAFSGGGGANGSVFQSGAADGDAEGMFGGGGLDWLSSSPSLLKPLNSSSRNSKDGGKLVKALF